MRKFFSFLKNNPLFISALFLLAFIPLYPKLPLLDIKNTWVYVRLEDFLVLSVIFLWLILFIKRKITLKTPLTIPIFAFWILGAVATIHGIILIFPKTPNIFPNIAFLSYLRHIEYLSMFFIAYSGMREKRFLVPVIITITGTFLAVVLYGFGQKFVGLPAFLTMNEEFAKGVPIYLSTLSRVPSTFAGHYDLAAYLVFIIPILVSLTFGFKNKIIKLFLLVLISLGYVLMFMTVSRVSFFVLLIAVFVVLFFQKKKIVLAAIPILTVFLIILIGFNSSLFERFGNTVKVVDVVVNGKTGAAVGNVKYVPISYFYDKNVTLQRIDDESKLATAMNGEITPSEASVSAKALLMLLPADTQVPLVTASNVSTGENLPQGTGYINLPLSPVHQRVGDFYYEISPNLAATTSAEVVNFHGNFIIKKAAAYDLSFTTRFQGEWPHALLAFERNILVGSGYGSVSLAVDNNFLRMLGEIGLLGTAAFLSIFLVVGIYIKKAFSSIEAPLAKSFIIGFGAGVIGLMFNALLIDVFEASKVAFTLWLTTGFVVGTLHVFSRYQINVYRELKKAAFSTYAVILYLSAFSVALFSSTVSNYFVGADFTWLRLQSAEYLYYPGTKLYFSLMYSVFWLNQDVYHIVSISLHFVSAVLFFLLSKKILDSKFLTFISSIIFIVLSGHSEAILTISSSGYLISTVSILASLLFYIRWFDGKQKLDYILSFIFIIFAISFNEIGIITPVLILLYKKLNEQRIKDILSSPYYLLLFAPSLLYILLRIGSIFQYASNTNLLFLPVKMIINLASYFLLTVLGAISSRISTILSSNAILGICTTVAILILIIFIYKKVFKTLSKKSRKIITFGSIFSLISVAPFIGLPVSSTFSYLPSMGIIILLVLAVNNLYYYLEAQGKDVAVGAVSIIFSVFCLLQIIQFQNAHLDAMTAGNKVKNFFISIDNLYTNSWSDTGVKLNFVNVPFPLELNDALWFAFQNKDLTIYTYPTLEQALQREQPTLTNHIFQFKDDGSVEQITVREEEARD